MDEFNREANVQRGMVAPVKKGSDEKGKWERRHNRQRRTDTNLSEEVTVTRRRQTETDGHYPISEAQLENHQPDASLHLNRTQHAGKQKKHGYTTSKSELSVAGLSALNRLFPGSNKGTCEHIERPAKPIIKETTENGDKETEIQQHDGSPRNLEEVCRSAGPPE